MTGAENRCRERVRIATVANRLQTRGASTFKLLMTHTKTKSPTQELIHTQQFYHWQHYRANRLRAAEAALEQNPQPGQQQQRQQLGAKP